jgi:hypothetical protein
MFITLRFSYPEGQWLKGDVNLYDYWSQSLVKGIFPLNDSMWQYPPLTGLVIGLPKLIFGNASSGFIVLMVIFDFLILITLLIFGLNRFKNNPESTGLSGLASSWFWVVWAPLMGPLVLTRFDVVPAFFAVLGLIALSSQTSKKYLFGFFITVGGLIKLWPFLLLITVMKRDLKKVIFSVVLSISIIILIINSFTIGMFNFLTNQSSRGLQVESIAAAPYVLAKLFGLSVKYPFRYGSLEVEAIFANQIAFALNVITILVFISLFILNYQNKLNHLNLFDKSLVIVLIAIATSRVFSPQFWVWVGAIAARALINKKTQLKKVIILLAGSAFLTQLLYPALYVGLLEGDLIPSLIQITRVILFCLALFRGTKLLLKQSDGKVNAYE